MVHNDLAYWILNLLITGCRESMFDLSATVQSLWYTGFQRSRNTFYSAEPAIVFCPFNGANVASIQAAEFRQYLL